MIADPDSFQQPCLVGIEWISCLSRPRERPPGRWPVTRFLVNATIVTAVKLPDLSFSNGSCCSVAGVLQRHVARGHGRGSPRPAWPQGPSSSCLLPYLPIPSREGKRPASTENLPVSEKKRSAFLGADERVRVWGGGRRRSSRRWTATQTASSPPRSSNRSSPDTY